MLGLEIEFDGIFKFWFIQRFVFFEGVVLLCNLLSSLIENIGNIAFKNFKVLLNKKSLGKSISKFVYSEHK